MKQTWEDLIARLLIARGAPAYLYQELLRKFRNQGVCPADFRQYTKPHHVGFEAQWLEKYYQALRKPLYTSKAPDSPDSNTENSHAQHKHQAKENPSISQDNLETDTQDDDEV